MAIIKSVEFNTQTLFFNLKVEGYAGLITCVEDQKAVLFQYSLVSLRQQELCKNGLAIIDGRLSIVDAEEFASAYSLPKRSQNVAELFESLPTK